MFKGYAEERFYNEFSSYIGMSIVTFAENEKAIEGENIQEPASGSVASISSSLQYRFWSDFKKAFYASATFPLLPSNAGTYLAFGVGMEYYFNDVGAKTGLYSSGTSITLTPTLRYFAGGEIGGAYLVYNTESATKSDALFELGATGGASYGISDKYAIKGMVGVMKGAGVITSTFAIKVLVGVTFFL